MQRKPAGSEEKVFCLGGKQTEIDKFVQNRWRENSMKKKYKRALAVALATVMIWNTCDWHPQALAGSAVQYIEEVKELSDEILHQEAPYGTK